MPIVKSIHARAGEIVEIHWHRTDPPGNPADLAAPTSELVMRYTAPPAASWEARVTEEKDKE